MGAISQGQALAGVVDRNLPESPLAEPPSENRSQSGGSPASFWEFPAGESSRSLTAGIAQALQKSKSAESGQSLNWRWNSACSGDVIPFPGRANRCLKNAPAYGDLCVPMGENSRLRKTRNGNRKGLFRKKLEISASGRREIQGKIRIAKRDD